MTDGQLAIAIYLAIAIHPPGGEGFLYHHAPRTSVLLPRESRTTVFTDGTLNGSHSSNGIQG